MEVKPVEQPTTVVPAASAPAVETPVIPVSGAGAEPIAKPELNADGTPKEVRGAEPSEAERRIQQLVAQRKDEEKLRIQKEQEVEYWRGVAEGRLKPAEPTPPGEKPVVADSTPPIPPSVDNFEKYEDFEAAKETYLISRAKWEMRQEGKKEEQARQVERAKTEWAGKMAKGKEKHEDFQQVVSNPAFIQTGVTAFLIQDSEIGDEVAYYLGKNLGEMSRINSLPPHLAAKEIGKIETLLLTPKPVEPKKIISQAPEPITTVVPSGGMDVDEDKLSMEEFVRRRNAKELAARRGKAA